MRLIAGFLIVVLLTCCGRNKDEVQRTYTAIEKELVFGDSLSIRAIIPLDENRVWFAGNLGKIGLIDGKTPKIAEIRYEDSLLHFRAVAKTKNSFFALSIANPAVLYKIGFDGIEATSMEEVYFESNEKVFYDAMTFWNDREGIAMGDPTEDCLSIIITRNGGNNWEKLSCDFLPKTEEGEAAFAASNSNIAVYGDHTWIVSGGKRARVFYSPDKGKSWEVFNTPIIEGGKMTGIYSVDFYDEKIGVIFGGDWENMTNNFSNKAITDDGGKTWRLIGDGQEPGYRSAVRFVPGGGGNEIVAAGSLGISYSNDRGNTWTELSKEGVFALEFVNDSLAFASGNNKILRLKFK